MAIIDETYFIDKISLPTDSDAYLNKLNRFIEKAQRKYLKQILGYELYTLFVAELPTPTTQRYIDILEGREFTRQDTGNTDKWTGLSNTDLESFLAYFTYVDYTDDSVSSASGTGVTNNEYENAIQISPITKQVPAYNDGVDHYNLLYDFLLANESTYPEWIKSGKMTRDGNILNI